MHAAQETIAPAASAGLVPGHFLRTSAEPQATITNKPIIGMYMYRSALAWYPICTSPTTGTSVPRYQNQPTARYGRVRHANNTRADTITTTAKAAAAFEDGIDCG